MKICSKGHEQGFRQQICCCKNNQKWNITLIWLKNVSMNFKAKFPTLMIFILLLQGPKISPFFQRYFSNFSCLFQNLFWPFTVWMNYSSDLKKFANSWPSALNFKKFSLSLEQFFLTVGQNNCGNKIPLFFYTTGKTKHKRDSTPWIPTLPWFLCQTFLMDSLLGWI